MNSVFSVFKGSGIGNGTGDGSDMKSTKSVVNSKSLLTATTLKENSSYGNLRHIRELESSINSFVVNADDGDDDDDTNSSSSSSQHTTIRVVGVGKRCHTPLDGSGKGPADSVAVVVSSISHSTDVVDFAGQFPGLERTTEAGGLQSPKQNGANESSAHGNKPTRQCFSKSTTALSKTDVCASLRSDLSSVPSACFSSDGDISSSCDLVNSSAVPICNTSSSQCSPASQTQQHHHHLNTEASCSSDDLTRAPIIANNSRGQSESNLSAKTANRFQKRLSLSGFPHNSMPSVHGRPATADASNAGVTGGRCGGAGSGEVKRTRLSTHQRNLSLDFR